MLILLYYCYFDYKWIFIFKISSDNEQLLLATLILFEFYSF